MTQKDTSRPGVRTYEVNAETARQTLDLFKSARASHTALLDDEPMIEQVASSMASLDDSYQMMSRAERLFGWTGDDYTLNCFRTAIRTRKRVINVMTMDWVMRCRVRIPFPEQTLIAFEDHTGARVRGIVEIIDAPRAELVVRPTDQSEHIRINLEAVISVLSIGKKNQRSTAVSPVPPTGGATA